MPVSAADIKWKIFRILCYLQIAAALSIIGFIVITTWAVWSLSSYAWEGTAWIMAAILIFFILAANGFSNLYLLEKFLPDRHPPQRASRFNLLLYILSFVAMCTIVGVMLYFHYEYLVYEQSIRLPTFLAGMLSVLFVTAIPIWVFQPLLRNRFNRNARLVADQFLDEDPFPNEEEL